MRTRREFIKELVISSAVVAVTPHMIFASNDPWRTVMPSILERIKPPHFPNRTFHLKPNDSTAAFRETIDQCASAGGGKVIVPPGTYLTGPIHLKSNVNLELSEG